jgi:N-methylhydantoinase B
MKNNNLNPADIEIIRNLFLSAAEQMRRTLVRTAFNAVIYEVLDFGISIADRSGRMISEAAGITSFIGANDFALNKLIDYLGIDCFEDGDIIILNYPYWNSAHAPDALLMAPIFIPGVSEPEIYLCVRAHWLDIGAKDGGYVIDSDNIHQEGLILPGVKIVKKGIIDEEILNIIKFNSRLPELLVGDFNAQISSIRTGEKCVKEAYEKYGVETIRESLEVLIDHSGNEAREAVANLPDGTWEAEEWLDDDGITDDMIRMAVKVTINGDRFIADYSDSDPMVSGPVNMPFGATISMAKTYFKYLTTPNSPSNHGHYSPLEVIVPEGNLFHAVYPSATYMSWTKMVAFELIAKALSQAVETIPASSGGDEPGFMSMGTHILTGKKFVVSNNEGIGWGASYQHDGATALQHPSTSSVRNTSVEVLEQISNIFHEKLELITDSAGAGKFRGGAGIRRDISFLADSEIISMKKKTKTSGWGLNGGRAESKNKMVIWPDTEKEIHVGMYRTFMKKGESFHNYSAGGSGWGNPYERDIESILDDVKNGYISIISAEREYGILINDDDTYEEKEERLDYRKKCLIDK